MKKSQAQGYLFEVIIGKLLERVGYRWSGSKDIKGRGSTHQIDAIGIGRNVTPFVNNIRLLAEAKYFAKGNVELPIVRNMFGVLKDIDESYFPDNEPIAKKLLGVRHTNCAVIFSNQHFSPKAIDYGYAHNIYLVSYKGNPVLKDILDDLSYIFSRINFRKTPREIKILKDKFNTFLQHVNLEIFPYFKEQFMNDESIQFIKRFKEKLEATGSVLGFIEGSYPIHITSKNRELPQLLLNLLAEKRGEVFYRFRLINENILFHFKLNEESVAEFTLPAYIFKKNLKEGTMLNAKELYLKNIYVPILQPRGIMTIQLIFNRD